MQVAEVEAEAVAQASGSSANSKHKRIRVRWRQARTLIFTMLAIDKQNAARVKEVAHELGLFDQLLVVNKHSVY